MRVYHDWEFLETGNSIYPISVGMVREDNEELYYEFPPLLELDLRRHRWLDENVLPNLHGEWISKSDIRTKVYNFLKVPDLELWGWYSSYDHVCLGQLFGCMPDMPKFVPKFTNDIRQEARRLNNVRIPDLKLDSEQKHHALDDARIEKRMHDWLIKYETDLWQGVMKGLQGTVTL